MDVFPFPVQDRFTFPDASKSILEANMKYATRMLAIVVTLMPLLASAQLSSNGIVAKVPFQFRAGNTVIPAGQCDVQRAGTDPRTLLIRNSSGKVALFTMARTVSATKGSSGNALIFHKYGERYFLSAIRVEGSPIAYQLSEGKAEAELRAQNVAASQEIVLAQLQ
jgi:hypothetical protein